MNAIPNSKPENAMIKDKGNKPNIKKSIPLVIISKVKPANMLNSICPDKMLAANLKPNDMFLARYDINSISTNNGNNPRGQPAGTNNEKNFRPCCWKPSIVAPKTIVKLKANVKIK